MVSEVALREGSVMVTAGPPDFCTFKGGLFVFGYTSKIRQWLINTAMSMPQNQSMFIP